MSRADELKRQWVLQRRFESMGLEAGTLPGGRAVIVTLPLRSEPLDTPAGPRTLRAVRFYTVGHDRIKCLAPRALFYLPLIRTLECDSPDALEDAIRAAWSRRMEQYRAAGRWLEGLGIEASSPQGTPQWTFDLGLDDDAARGAAVEPGRVVIPSRGPLSGTWLATPEDREFAPDPELSGAELALAVTGHIESVARTRRRRAPRRTADEDLPAPRAARTAPVLLVGRRLAGDRTLHESLRMRGFEIWGASSVGEAIQVFRERSCEVVLAETRVDRGDGLELIPALRAIPGMLELPIAMHDERPRDGRRAAARAAGATAYLTGTLEPTRLAPALARMAVANVKRRFRRYDRALSVSWPDCEAPAVTQSVGRGGLLLRGEGAPQWGHFSIHVPDVGLSIGVDADRIYELEGEPASSTGAGLRFRQFDTGHEAAWIDYITAVAAEAAA